jgi:hypothetical protein
LGEQIAAVGVFEVLDFVITTLGFADGGYAVLCGELTGAVVSIVGDFAA